MFEYNYSSDGVYSEFDFDSTYHEITGGYTYKEHCAKELQTIKLSILKNVPNMFTEYYTVETKGNKLIIKEANRGKLRTEPNPYYNPSESNENAKYITYMNQTVDYTVIENIDGEYYLKEIY